MLELCVCEHGVVGTQEGIAANIINYCCQNQAVNDLGVR